MLTGTSVWGSGDVEHTNQIGAFICDTTNAAASCKLTKHTEHTTAVYTRCVDWMGTAVAI